MSSTPGPRTPGSAESDSDTVDAAGVAVDATGTTRLGGAVPDDRTGTVTKVVVDSSVADFDFNILVNGTQVFSAAQSLSAAGTEVFIPDAAAKRANGDVLDLEVDVTAASATTGATATVSVEVES